MQKFVTFTMASTLLLALAACSQPAQVVPAAPAPIVARSQQAVATAIAGAAAPVVKDLGFKDGPALSVAIQAPQADRALLAVQHRWVTSDITTYHVELWTADATTGAKTGATALTSLDIAPAALAAPALAAFTGLPANSKYVVTVEAMGQNTTTTATTGIRVLNSQTPASTVFNFLEDANNNIENSPAAQSVTIQLDSYTFSGSATVNATTTNGTWLAAAGGVVGTPTVTTKLTFLDATSNKVSLTTYTPETSGVPKDILEGHFRYVLKVPASTPITRISLIGSGFGSWDTNIAPSQWLLGVFANNVSVSGGVVGGPLGTYSGAAVFDLYLPTNNTGTTGGTYFEPGALAQYTVRAYTTGDVLITGSAVGVTP